MTSAFSDYERALRWRRPTPLWTSLAAIAGLGAPALFLLPEGGFGQFVLTTAALGFGAALAWLFAAQAMGRLPTTRRDIVALVLRIGVGAALVAPFLFQALLAAIAASEGSMGESDLPGGLPFALMPLALMIGLPISLFCGLALSGLAFVRRDPEPLF